MHQNSDMVAMPAATERKRALNANATRKNEMPRSKPLRSASRQLFCNN
jgi:hypothetical protein